MHRAHNDSIHIIRHYFECTTQRREDYTHIQARARTHTHTHTPHTHTHTHTPTHTHIHPPTHTHAHLHAHRHRHTHRHQEQELPTSKKLTWNTREPLPCKYYLPTTLDTQKQRHTPQSLLIISTFHTLDLSPIENEMRQAYAHIAKPWRQINPPTGNKDVPKIKEMSD